MKLVFEPDYQALLALIRDECGLTEKPYLVGGAVRDTLIGMPLHDMDFVMGVNPTQLAKRLAKRLNAGFFMLDDERNTARVVYYDRDGRFFPLDFVQFTGRDLAEDLRNRDFTVNAMAVSIEEPNQLIDPLKGQSDLAQRLLRACSEHALMDDPVRVLRGVRLAIQFGFDYAPGLESALQEAAFSLPRTSLERQRDEFFRLLAGPDPAEGLRHCRRLGVFEPLIPPLVHLEDVPAFPPHQLPLFDHTIKTVEHYHGLLRALTTGVINNSSNNWPVQETLTALGKFSKEIDTYFKEEITPGRSLAGLAYFGTLLHDVGKPVIDKDIQGGDRCNDLHAQVGADLAYETAKQLTLSNAESAWVDKFVRNHMRLMPLVKTGQIPLRRSVYRFFKSTDDAGVAVALHTLADTWATYGANLDRDRWDKSLSVVMTMLAAWWEDRKVMIDPAPLLDGYDLQKAFGLAPGKIIGRLLNELVEEQASGNVTTVEEAREFINQRLSGIN